MARAGRQPKQLIQKSTSKSSGNGKKGAGKGKKSTQNQQQQGNPLHLYSYSASKKDSRPRGDVDPASRPTTKKSKGKGRQEAEEEDSEGSEAGSDDEDGFTAGKDEIVEFTGQKPKGLKMGNSDDEEEESDEEISDEEIDSDEAEGDEEELPKKGLKKGKKAKRAPEEVPIDLDEEEIDWDDSDGEGFMDISNMLDGGTPPASDSDEDEESDSGSEMDDDEEESESEDSEYEGALDKLSSFVDGLEGRKRKAGEDDERDGEKKKKRVVLKEKTEAYPEGDFVAVGSEGQGKVQLEDLLSTLSSSSNPRLQSLRQSLKPLLPTLNPSKKNPAKLDAPLPARLQDKIERESAYAKTKEETDKWNETVRRMKGESGLGVEGARHERLVLPLRSGAADLGRDPNGNEWSAKFQPSNDLEASITSLLAAGSMDTKSIQRTEKAALAALDPADLIKRQSELRAHRDLMFQAERKAKRVSKIKSKAFRRIHRRARNKGEFGGLSLEDLEELDRIDGGGRVAEERARMEMARAEERVSLKHSSKGGRWSKAIGGLEGLEEERNTAIRDMVKRGEDLRKKIKGVDSDEESQEEREEEEDDDEDDFEGIRNKAFDELAALNTKEGEEPKLKGVMNMKFMRDARNRDDRKAQNQADELRKTLEDMDRVREEDSEEEDEPMAMSETVQGNLGRMVFGPTAGSTQAQAPTTKKFATESSSSKSAAPAPIIATTLTLPSTSTSTSDNRSPLSTAPVAEANPWLSLADDEPSTSKISRKMNKAATGKDTRDASKLAAKVSKHQSKQAPAREKERDDAEVEVDLSKVLVGANAKKVPQIQGAPTKENAAREADDESEEEELDEEEIEAQRGRGPAAFKQRELVARAFAGDDVVAEFEAEKRREIERDAPREEDNTLPGWGAWSGKGVKKPKNAMKKKFITKIAGIAPEKRQDASHTNVIISEKKDKKAAKYLLKDLPFPYTSAAQHEHKLRTPLGPEWSTSTILRDQTLPKVLIKPGVTIRPVDKKDA